MAKSGGYQSRQDHGCAGYFGFCEDCIKQGKHKPIAIQNFKKEGGE